MPATPTAPDEDALRTGAAKLGVVIDDEVVGKLLNYLSLLRRWNATFNLTAVRDPQAMLVQHLLDCLAILPSLGHRLPRGGRVLDVGSGGGLPGVPIAAVMPEVEVTCVETVGKKAAFIRQVAGAMAMPNLHAVHARVEALDAGAFDVITARAFATLGELTRLTGHHLASAGAWMAMKGRVPDEEIRALPGTIDVFHVEQLSIPGLDAQRCLVWMRQRPSAEAAH